MFPFYFKISNWRQFYFNYLKWINFSADKISLFRKFLPILQKLIHAKFFLNFCWTFSSKKSTLWVRKGLFLIVLSKENKLLDYICNSWNCRFLPFYLPKIKYPFVFAKLNPRQMFQFLAFAKINPGEIKQLCSSQN